MLAAESFALSLKLRSVFSARDSGPGTLDGSLGTASTDTESDAETKPANSSGTRVESLFFPMRPILDHERPVSKPRVERMRPALTFKVSSDFCSHPCPLTHRPQFKAVWLPSLPPCMPTARWISMH